VPRISTFYGIVIAMYYRDHAPPHFHAVYGEHEATITIGELEVLSGCLPTRALRLVLEWAELHGDELAATGRGPETASPSIASNHWHDHPRDTHSYRDRRAA
jgi:Domain of unknown function (DUF4160)